MNIKKGDLVMIVRPSSCCGCVANIGRLFAVEGVDRGTTHCVTCNLTTTKTFALFGLGLAADIHRLKRIDPPADGDCLPTRRELCVTA